MGKVLQFIGGVTLTFVALALAASWATAALWPVHALPVTAWVSLALVLATLVLVGMLDRRAPIFGRIFYRGRHDQPLIALTFDDGPNDVFTARILDVLGQAGVRATFFLIGEHVERSPAVVRRMAAEGHEIGNHTYNHALLPLATASRIRRQVHATSEVIARVAGVRPRLFRAPHGWRNPWVQRMARLEGCETVAWTLGVWDTDRPGAEAIRERTTRGLSNGCVVLLHDGRGLEVSTDSSQLVEALPHIIDDAHRRGFTFVTLGHLMDQAVAR